MKEVKVETSGGRTRKLRVIERRVVPNEYGKELREIAIMGGHGKEKPVLIITNDFKIKTEDVIRKYAQRWLVEKDISEHTHFFHLNKVSSSMVVKVDFDLTMTILAHNLYRLLAKDLPGYTTLEAQSLYEKFIDNSGYVEIDKKETRVFLKKKRNLPALLSSMDNHQSIKPSWLNQRLLKVSGASTS